jgi:hypothetical protein
MQNIKNFQPDGRRSAGRENEERIVFETELAKIYLEVDDYYDYDVENDDLYNEVMINSDCVASNGMITGE